jgi:hypothetical protein
MCFAALHESGSGPSATSTSPPLLKQDRTKRWGAQTLVAHFARNPLHSARADAERCGNFEYVNDINLAKRYEDFHACQ